MTQKGAVTEQLEDTAMVVFSDDNQKFIFSIEDLKSESEYFRALLESGMIESSKREVSLPCVSSNGLEMVQSYLTSKKDTTMTKSISILYKIQDLPLKDWEEILHAAIYLQMSELLKFYETNLMRRLEVDNIFEIRSLAETFSLKDTLENVDNYLKKNISKIWRNEAFFSEYKTIESLALLLESNDLDFTDGEFEVCMIIDEFFQHNDHRASELDYSHVVTLMNCLRVPLLDKNYRENTVIQIADFIKEHYDTLPNDFVMNLQKFHKRAISFLLNPNKIYTLDTKDPWRRIRCSQLILLGCGGFTQSESSTNRVQYLPAEHLHESCKSLTELQFTKKGFDRQTKLPTALVEHAVCVLNGHLYIAGGQHKYCTDGRHTSNKCYRFDSLHKRWDEICSMNSTRSLFYLGELNGSLYAVCGWTGPNSVTKSVERYDVLDDKWEEVARCPIGLHEHAGCSHKGQIYVSGGYRGPYRGHLNQVWSYDPETNVWLDRKPLSHRRSYHAMSSVGEKIYVTGGVNYIGDDAFEDVMIIEVYDPSVDQWSDLTQRLPRPACCMSSLVLDTRILLFGGHSFEDDTDHSMLQIFETSTGQFTECVINSDKVNFFPVALINVKLDTPKDH